jgi:hypothetical protein
MVETTTVKQHWGFQKGQSGNPAGRPIGARHKVTLMAEKLMADDAGKIVNAVIAAAINGDMMAAKIILDRIAPVRRSTSFHLPAIESRADEPPARMAILEAVANGLLTPSEATNMFDLIERVVWALPACIEGTNAET